MGVFGGKYPRPMQSVVDHGARFCGVLSELEQLDNACGRRSRQWLIGRPQEVEAVITLLVRDWATGRIGLQEARAKVAAYLDELHTAAERWLGPYGVLECCSDDEALTVNLAAKQEAVTRIAVDRPPTKEGGETWFDPSALLEFRATPHPDAKAAAPARKQPTSEQGVDARHVTTNHAPRRRGQ
jgi:hypothetical protein